MNNFHLIRTGLIVDAARQEAETSAFWNWLNLRRSYAGSCHTQTEDLILRFASVERPQTYASLMDGLDSVTYLTWYNHPQLAALVVTTLGAFLPPDTQLGRVMVTKLPPGASIAPHRDEGAYAQAHDRYHLVLNADREGCIFTCGDETVEMLPGELWTFNHELMHEVRNHSTVDRLNLIMDVKR